jgi:hypothetical protein
MLFITAAEYGARFSDLFADISIFTLWLSIWVLELLIAVPLYRFLYYYRLWASRTLKKSASFLCHDWRFRAIFRRRAYATALLYFARAYHMLWATFDDFDAEDLISLRMLLYDADVSDAIDDILDASTCYHLQALDIGLLRFVSFSSLPF